MQHPDMTTGTVVDYTIRRTRYLIDWAQQTMALDPGRTYTYGYSMGGAGATNIAFHLGDRIAGAISAVGNSDLSFMADPDTAFFFSLHGYLRQDIDRLWGTVATNLPAAAGGRVYEQLNCGFLATDPAHGVVPPVFVFNGKRDTTMGWAENIGFYQAMERGHRGGAFYWEDVPHNTTYAPAWQPLRTPRDLYRYRTDLSFPALSNCSIDDDPGDGVASHGAPLGCINGYARWDSLLTDTSPRWQVGLQLRTLVLTDRTLTPPDSARIDVTPRRVQRFAFTPGRELLWKVLRLPDSLTVQQGGLVVPANGELTIPGVRVYAKGSVLRIEPDLHLGLGDNAAAALRPGITFARSPVRGRAAFRIVWPARGAARADLYDVSGRAVRELFRGEAGETPSDLALETGTLAPGLYLVGAEVAGRRIAGRVVVLR